MKATAPVHQDIFIVLPMRNKCWRDKAVCVRNDSRSSSSLSSGTVVVVIAAAVAVTSEEEGIGEGEGEGEEEGTGGEEYVDEV